MQFTQTLLVALMAIAGPSLVNAVAIPPTNVEGRSPEPVASAVGSDCSIVPGAVGASIVCDTPNGKTIDGQPAAQVKANGLKPAKTNPTKAKAKATAPKKTPTPVGTAAKSDCSTVAGAVGIAVVCNGPNGKTIDGKPVSS